MINEFHATLLGACNELKIFQVVTCQNIFNFDKKGDNWQIFYLEVELY